MMTHVDLFSGIGGIALAARWAGFDTVAFCEIDPYCRRVLAKHWPGVPCHDDVRTFGRETIAGREGVTLLTGGFPCQPFSDAGKRRGKADDRHLWPEMFRVIRECGPAWVVGENVAGFVRMALDDVLADLEAEGYACRTFMVPAVAIGARHRRDRVFVVANAARGGQHDITLREALPRCFGDQWSRFPTEPRVGRVADGVPGRVDRLRGLGNAVVPQQIYPILKGIAALVRPREGVPACG